MRAQRKRRSENRNYQAADDGADWLKKSTTGLGSGIY
jgi:hypothetical protein